MYRYLYWGIFTCWHWWKYWL